MTNVGMQVLNGVHGQLIFGRRVKALSRALAETLPQGAGRVLDLGCGDGQVALGVMAQRSELSIEGVDVFVREKAHIPVTVYDSVTLPFADCSFDHVTIVDVLHHTDDPAAVLREAARVAKTSVVIKDHLRDGMLAGPTLRLMDWVGNAGHGVRLPYNYLSSAQWREVYAQSGLVEESRTEKIDLYSKPLNWLFERNLHFIARFKPVRA